jgi:hypothetical protein
MVMTPARMMTTLVMIASQIGQTGQTTVVRETTTDGIRRMRRVKIIWSRLSADEAGSEGTQEIDITGYETDKARRMESIATNIAYLHGSS